MHWLPVVHTEMQHWCPWVLIKCSDADPLRVLRAIRFGARFGFTLSSEVEEAAASPKVCIEVMLD